MTFTLKSPSSLETCWHVAHFVQNNDVDLESFIIAVSNLILHPNINSTAILRADLLYQCVYDSSKTIVQEHTPEVADLDPELMPLRLNSHDTTPRVLALKNLDVEKVFVRRVIPRNPLRDAVINQTCSIYKNVASNHAAVVFLAHVTLDESPFYLPDVEAVALTFQNGCVQTEYLNESRDSLTRRKARIAFHLANTAVKHSLGVRSGYKKRVTHDQIVDRVAFQTTYMRLKQKYAGPLIAKWVEKTDPKKHVFEDLGIAAFLIELWRSKYKSKTDFEFLDLGCGNGLLVYLLVSEGYYGSGVDARARRSWTTYPSEVQSRLREAIVLPPCLDLQACHSLKNRPTHVLGASKSTFIIGNHSDELTLWIPLIGSPFVVIPCCSYALSGQRQRFGSSASSSRYAGLVDKVDSLARLRGWRPQRESLRIPTTRNMAIVGLHLDENMSLDEILADEPNLDCWADNIVQLTSSNRDH